MEKKSRNFSELQQLAQSEAGQQLLSLLRSTHPQALEQATQKAAQGQFSEAADSLSAVLATPEIRELLRKLEG